MDSEAQSCASRNQIRLYWLTGAGKYFVPLIHILYRILRRAFQNFPKSNGNLSEIKTIEQRIELFLMDTRPIHSGSYHDSPKAPKFAKQEIEGMVYVVIV